jgi:hypothetical protein
MLRRTCTWVAGILSPIYDLANCLRHIATSRERHARPRTRVSRRRGPVITLPDLFTYFLQPDRNRAWPQRVRDLQVCWLTSYKCSCNVPVMNMLQVIQRGAAETARRERNLPCPFCGEDPPLAARIAGRFVVGCQATTVPPIPRSRPKAWKMRGSAGTGGRAEGSRQPAGNGNRVSVHPQEFRHAFRRLSSVGRAPDL